MSASSSLRPSWTVAPSRRLPGRRLAVGRRLSGMQHWIHGWSGTADRYFEGVSGVRRTTRLTPRTATERRHLAATGCLRDARARSSSSRATPPGPPPRFRRRRAIRHLPSTRRQRRPYLRVTPQYVYDGSQPATSQIEVCIKQPSYIEDLGTP